MSSRPPASRVRSARLGALALALSSLPFLVLGTWLLEARARTALTCTSAGACTLEKGGWLTGGVVARFGPGEVRALRVERLRSSRPGARVRYRPVLELPGGSHPLAYRWADSPQAPEALLERVEAWRRSPQAGLVLVSDERRGALVGGGAFVAVGAALLAAGGALSIRARKATTRRGTDG